MDPNVKRVINKMCVRAECGLAKYGCDTTRTDLTLVKWLEHFQEELLDAAVYSERLIQERTQEKDPCNDDGASTAASTVKR